MTGVAPQRRRLGSERGFTLIEMLIATLIMVVVTGAMFDLLNPANGMFNTQPEVADMQQRMRVGVDSLEKDLVMAGAGTYIGSSAGALYNFFAPVMPYRAGDINADPPGTFRKDTISILYVPPTPAQTTVNKAMGNGNSREIDVDAQANCGSDKHDQLCGFHEGKRVLIFEPGGSWDTVTITNVQDEALHLQHTGQLSSGYDSGGAVISEVAAHTYYLKQDNVTNTYQLMHYDGYLNDVPVADDVVKLEFEYYGDPEPPRMLPGKCLTAGCTGPWTTYGPRPPALGVPSSGWPNGENCAFMVQGGAHVPRLEVISGGGINQVKLDEGRLKDGPWCPNAAAPNRYDADLLRIRRVRVSLRVQVSKPWMRGPAGVLFSKGGTAKPGLQQVPDQEIKFDISPRNMNLGR